MPLTRYFGETPRVRAMEAILRLASLESFTMKDVAKEAGLFPPSTYATIRQLAKEGFLEKGSKARPETFRVPRTKDIQLLYMIDAAIGHLTGPVKTRRPSEVVARFADLAGAVGRSEMHVRPTSPGIRIDPRPARVTATTGAG